MNDIWKLGKHESAPLLRVTITFEVLDMSDMSSFKVIGTHINFLGSLIKNIDLIKNKLYKDLSSQFEFYLFFSVLLTRIENMIFFTEKARAKKQFVGFNMFTPPSIRHGTRRLTQLPPFIPADN